MRSYQMDCVPTVNSSSHSNSCAKNTGNSKKNNKKNCWNKSKVSSVKLSIDPQSVAARERRHRISDRFKTLQSMIPGGSKMDTVSMLEEAIHYVKFLKTQIWLHQTMINLADDDPSMVLSGYSVLPQQQPPCPLEDLVEGVQCLPHHLPLHSDQIQRPCFQGEDTLFFDTANVNYWASN